MHTIKHYLVFALELIKFFLKKKKNYTAQRKEKHYGLLMSQLFSQSRQME